MWGNLQTAEYTAAAFQQVVDFSEIPDDPDAEAAVCASNRFAPGNVLSVTATGYHCSA